MTADMTAIDRPPRRARRAAATLLSLTLLAAGAAACAQETDDGAITMEPVDAVRPSSVGRRRPSCGSTVTASAPATPAAKQATVERSAFTHGS